MTEQVDLDALIAEARSYNGVVHNPLMHRLAAALESTAAELRQEREQAEMWRVRCAEETTAWADEAQEKRDLEAALSRAEETIEKAARLIERNEPWVAHTALTEYGNQKGRADD